MFPLNVFFRRLIKTGDLRVVGADGREHRFGDGGGEPVTMHLHSRLAPWKIFFRPAVAAGEAYMDGSLTFENCDILDFLNLVSANAGCGAESRTSPPWDRKRLAHILSQLNDARRAQRNVAHHYNFSTEFYDQFLDPARQYSCAYFHGDNDSLEQAQRNKMAHVGEKLLLRPQHKVLDIGCGWGGLSTHLAETAGCHVTGVSLSSEQVEAARKLASEKDLEDRLDFRLQDYRDVEGPFDRIVSVGMFEHVGRPQYATYFSKINELLDDDGVALVHTIGRSDGPGGTNPWTAKYIFPGGYSPALSEVMLAIEGSGLFVTDIEVLRLHYAKTCRAWYRRFQDSRAEIRDMYDERFCRMFEFFLAGCVGAFETEGLVVFQIQLSRSQDAVPLTRDYLYS